MKRHFDKRYIAVTSMRFHRVFPILRFKYREASEWKSKYKLRAGNFDLLISSQFFAASTSFCQKSILSSFISVQFHRGHCLPATTTKTRYSVQMRCPAFQNCLTFTSTSLDIRATDHTSSYHVISICGWFALPSLWSCAIYLKLHVSYVSHLSGLCIGSQMTFHPDIILFGFSFSLFCPFWSCLLFTFGFHGWPATAWSHRFDPYLAAALSWFAVWFGANRLQCRHLHISRHNDMPLPSRATTYNALCWKISQLVFGVFLNSNQPDPTKPNHHPSSPSLTSTRPACQSNSHCKLQHHPVGGSHNAMVKIRFLWFGLLKWHFTITITIGTWDVFETAQSTLAGWTSYFLFSIRPLPSNGWTPTTKRHTAVQT